MTGIRPEYGRAMSPASKAVTALGLCVALAGCTASSPEGPSKTTGRPPAIRATAQAPEPVPSVPFEQVRDQILAYRKAHGANGGKDWDVNTKTAGQLTSDPAARQLLALCGKDQRPVIPWLAWEYGGNDHQWIHPEKSALVYCVYTPVRKSTDDWSEHWKYDKGKNHVIADIYVRFPEQNPCRDKVGSEQVDACIGDHTNYEILVDTVNLDDGHAAKLELAEASTTLWLILPNNARDLLANF